MRKIFSSSSPLVGRLTLRTPLHLPNSATISARFSRRKGSPPDSHSLRNGGAVAEMRSICAVVRSSGLLSLSKEKEVRQSELQRDVTNRKSELNSRARTRSLRIGK